ncbi:hypothetical protein [Planosporangium mesophilum]|uniref:Integral membrane protein n=1 Tax=Planosporangium mesophilum TaxID=689768 RepID=A0A8J3X152_9ACTN|nr:hypothetical protein [Planosporangium mesophilum]NJC85439.1 hypothetical protein [Planosporangium mesophilum]GII24050.1 hypothetical protein Pme01_36470 [Planosporangium mesophilum]
MSAGAVYLSVNGRPFTDTPPRPSATPLQPDGMDELRRRMTPVCESAVDALEIAAALEAEGLSDQAVRTRYGYPDVFALAEHLYGWVPRRPAEPPALPERWRTRPAEHVVHGLLYATPAVCFPVAAPLLTGTATLVGFLVSTLVSWASSQALAHLGYARAGRLDPAGSLWILRAGTAVALGVLWVALATSAALVPAPTAGMVFAAGQGTYLLAATVLLVCGRNRWLLLCLAPGVLGSTGFLLLGRPAWLTQPVWWALGASLAATLVCAVVCTARPGPGGRSPARHELRDAVPPALFGLAAAGLLTFEVVASQLTGRLSYLAPLLAAPLSVSMGAAEWNLYWYRRRTDRLLCTTRDPEEFAAGARRALLAATTRYLAAAALLIAAMAGFAAITDRPTRHWMTLVSCAAFLALGGALFVALLLQAFGTSLVTPLAAAAALGIEVALAAVVDVDPVAAQLVACAALTAGLLGYAGRVLSRVTQHG